MSSAPAVHASFSSVVRLPQRDYVPPGCWRWWTSLLETWHRGYEAPTPIAEYLLLGDREDAQRRDLLISLGVTHVLNTAKQLPNYFEDDFLYHRVDVYDHEAEQLRPHYARAFEFIDDAREHGSVVFVHCVAGAFPEGVVGRVGGPLGSRRRVDRCSCSSPSFRRRVKVGLHRHRVPRGTRRNDARQRNQARALATAHHQPEHRVPHGAGAVRDRDAGHLVGRLVARPVLELSTVEFAPVESPARRS